MVIGVMCLKIKDMEKQKETAPTGRLLCPKSSP